MTEVTLDPSGCNSTGSDTLLAAQKWANMSTIGPLSNPTPMWLFSGPLR